MGFLTHNKMVSLLLQHMTSSGHESMGSFPSMHSLAKASPATSLIAETFTTTEQVCTVGIRCFFCHFICHYPNFAKSLLAMSFKFQYLYAYSIQLFCLPFVLVVLSILNIYQAFIYCRVAIFNMCNRLTIVMPRLANVNIICMKFDPREVL